MRVLRKRLIMGSGMSWNEVPGTDHWQVRVNRTRGVIWLERTPVPFGAPEDLDASLVLFQKLLARIEGGAPDRLLFDLRKAPGRNDEAFERSTKRLRTQLDELFDRVAILVRSQVGKLQVTRLNKGEAQRPGHTEVFTDEAAALDWLTR